MKISSTLMGRGRYTYLTHPPTHRGHHPQALAFSLPPARPLILSSLNTSSLASFHSRVFASTVPSPLLQLLFILSSNFTSSKKPS